MLLVTALVSALAATASAQDTAALQAREYDAKVLVELADLAPGATPDAEAAATAYRDGRWQEALEAYGRVLAVAPRFHHALRRSGTAKLELGDRDGALALCRQALAAASRPENRVALARTLVHARAPARATQADREEAVRLARQALSAAPQDLVNVLGACSAGLDAADDSLVADCATRLLRLDPGSLGTEYFGVFGALIGQRYDEARRHLAAARAAGLPPAAAESLARVIEENEPFTSRWGRPALLAALGWIALLLLLLGAGSLLSAATLRRARSMATDRQGEAATGAAALRRIYATVLWLTCAAYYLSLPLVLLTIVGGAVAIFLGLQAAGTIPIKLVVVVAIVVMVSAWAVLKSLWVSLVRPRQDDPGQPLDLAGHPRFEAALRQAAERVGTRPVDRVFLTPGTDAAVFERGGMVQQAAGRSERCLILGVGLLEGMTQGQLKAVLAHEYGHFVNRDTAGGGLALAVRRAVWQMAESLASGGAARWYNPAWLFVTGFHKLFLRVSQGASRLQEILADRWAALAYGGAEFAAGLRHVVTRDVRFERHAEASLKEVIDGQRPLRNLYAYAPAQAVDEAEVALTAGRILDAEPTAYASHPRPADRIAWVGDVTSIHPGDPEAVAPAWELFTDRDALERQLTDQVRSNVAERHGIVIPAEPGPGQAVAAPQPAVA